MEDNDSFVTLANAVIQGKTTKNWIVGHFKDSPLLHSEDVEIKWDTIEAGAKNEAFSAQGEGTSISMLVRGRMEYLFRVPQPAEPHKIEYVEIHRTLDKEGDFLIWGPKVYHWWHAFEDSLVITVRWPSKVGDVYRMPK